MKRRWHYCSIYLISAAMLLVVWFNADSPPSEVRQILSCGDKSSPPIVLTSQSDEPSYVYSLVYKREQGVAHSPTIAQHSNGRIQAIWFAGVEEAAAETGLMQAWYVDGKWSKAETILTAKSDSLGRDFWINTIGNPVLGVLPDGEAWLFYVTPSMGGWATARISLRRSFNHGVDWGPAQTLQTSPLFNISTLVRQGLVCLSNGNYGLPIHFELLRDYPIFAELDADGSVVGLNNMFATKPAGIQPLVLADGRGHYDALLRPTKGMKRRTYLSQTANGGISWSDPRPTGLANPGSPLCGLSLGDGGRLIGYNNNPDRRSNFTLAFQKASGANWQVIEDEFGAGSAELPYAYCTLIEDDAGSFHLVFSNRKEGEIHHVRFNSAWIASRL